MRVLLCGTNYGSFYLRALFSNEHFKLAGILARSDRSKDLARQCNVPFFTSVADVPKDIAAACVAISGDAGFRITEELLGRGVHVLEEHPQATAVVAAHRQTARAHRAVYHVNAHYSDLDAAAAFIETYRATVQVSRVLFVNILTNARALYSALEIISRAAGPLYGIALTHVPAGPNEFFNLSKSGPLTIQMQNVFSAVDDGSANWVSHRISAGFEAGVLELVEAQGPLTWTDAPPSIAQLNSPAGAELWNRPHWRLLTPPPPTLGEFVGAGRDRANRIALARFAGEIATGVTPPEQSDAHLFGVSQIWDSITAASLARHTNLGA